MTIIDGHVVTRKEHLTYIQGEQLLKFYNAKTGQQKSRFHSREKGEEQVWEVVRAHLNEPAKGRKVHLKYRGSTKPTGRPKSSSADGRVLAFLEKHKGQWVKLEDMALELDRTVPQVRSSLSYLRRKYGYRIDAQDSMTVMLK